MAFFETWKAARLVDTHRKPMGATGLGQGQTGATIYVCNGMRLGWERPSHWPSPTDGFIVVESLLRMQN